MTPKYEYKKSQEIPNDKGDMHRLEREVAEIKQTTKETNSTVTDLSKNVVRIETILLEGNKAVQLQINQIDTRSKSNEQRLDDLEDKAINNDTCSKDLDVRIKKIEDAITKIVWVIVLAVLGAILAQVIK